MHSYPDILNRLWRAATAPRSADAPTVISTFSGAGLSLLGYMAAGYRPLLAVDCDVHAVEVLRLNFPKCPVWCGDIRDLTVEELMELTGLQMGELDLLDASPPCEGFSLNGDRRVNDPRNLLPWEVVRIVAGLRPRAFVIEEVPALAQGRTKHLYDRLIEDLENCGYRVEPKVLSAVDFGVPQERERLILIGSRKDLDAPTNHPAKERKQ
jgi:DNA (cytosine-5)-methyltransferase 1